MSRQDTLKRVLGVALILVSLAGCVAPAVSPSPEAATPGAIPPTPVPLLQSARLRLKSNASDAEVGELVTGNSTFAVDLYQSLRQDSKDNLLFSPYSISLALAMTFAGPRGATEREMATTLHYTLPQERLHPAFNSLDAALTGYSDEGGDFQLHIANAIWGQEGHEFLSAFVDTLAEDYGAGLHTLDFAGQPEPARQAINEWVSDQTKERIQNVIPEGMLTASVRLVLTNAIYFNGKWVSRFKDADTRDEPFTLLDGSRAKVAMMSQQHTFEYTEGDGYQAVQLAYRDSTVTMLFVLPAITRFEEFGASFTPQVLDEVIADLSTRLVRLHVPKFEFESAFSLTQTLDQMGMPSAFGGNADFSGMTGTLDLAISNVVHKAFVAVDEEGTEAAAATAIIEVEKSMEKGPEVVVMRLDHPFLFLIRDKGSGTILFMGRVLDPRS